MNTLDDIIINTINQKIGIDFNDLIDCSLLLEDKYNGLNFEFHLFISADLFTSKIRPFKSPFGRSIKNYGELSWYRYRSTDYKSEFIHKLDEPSEFLDFDRIKSSISHISLEDDIVDFLKSYDFNTRVVCTLDNLRHMVDIGAVEEQITALYTGTEKEKKQLYTGKKISGFNLFSNQLEFKKYIIEDFRTRTWFRPCQFKVNGKWVNANLFNDITNYKFKSEFIKDIQSSINKIEKYLMSKGYKVNNLFDPKFISIGNNNISYHPENGFNKTNDVYLEYLDTRGHHHNLLIAEKIYK